MGTIIHQASDKLFKQSMADSRVAREFFIHHLPVKLLEKIDLNSLKLQKNSFIDDAYKAWEADVIYTATIGHNMAYFYLLCENQNHIDSHIAFRLLIYIVRIMELHKKQYPKDALPLVYPFVIYNGDSVWNAPQDIYPLFGEHEALAREILFKPYQLIDIKRCSDDDLELRKWSGLVEFALKHNRTRHTQRYLKKLFAWLVEIESLQGGDYASFVLRYAVHHLEENDRNILIKIANQHLSARLGDEVMTLTQSYEKEGFQRGMQQGMQQGEYSLLLRQLQSKFHVLPENFRQQMLKASAEQLLEWGERLIHATTLQDVFADS